MKLFERSFGNNFEKLLTYYPRYYRDVFEMVEILKAQGKLADDLEDSIEQVFLNCFIDYADEKKINQLEVFLKIGRSSSLTLDERRRVVKSYFLGAGKLSASQLTKMLQNITGCPEPDIRLEPIDAVGNNALLIDFACQENAAQKLAAVRELFSRKVPAHLKMLITAISRFDTKFPNKEHFQPIILRLPFRIINGSREIIRLNGERYLDGSWPLDQDVRSLIFQSMLVGLAVREQERLSAAGAMRLQSRVSNSETLCWPQLEFGLRIGNLAFTRLNGERRLDGSWFLEQTAGGTELVSLEIQSGWQLENRAMTAGSMQLPKLNLANANNAVWAQLHLNSRLTNSNAAEQPELRLQSSWQEQNSIAAGTLTRDTMWRLGGASCLDGGKKLNAAIITENL